MLGISDFNIYYFRKICTTARSCSVVVITLGCVLDSDDILFVNTNLRQKF